MNRNQRRVMLWDQTESGRNQQATRATALTAVGLLLALGAGTLLHAVPAQAVSAQNVQTWTGAKGSGTGEAVSPQSCDFTGDGRPDVVTSAWMWDRAPFGSIGATYVIPGGSSRPGELDDPSSGAIRIEGPQSEDPLTGFSVSCLGDTNGDRIDDIAISDYIDNRVYVVFGSTEKENLSLQYLGDRGYVIQSPDDDRTGFQVSGVGDLNGDGLADVAVTSLLANDRGGRVSIVAGHDDVATVDLSASSEVIARIDGSRNQGISTVAPAGDVNGDGRPDLVLGGYVAKTGAGTSTANGMAWVVFGPSHGTVDLSSSFDGFAVKGPDRGRDRLGISATALGDIDHDGFDDVALGADGVSQRVSGRLDTRPGAVAVVRGSASRETVSTDPAAAHGKSVYAGDTDRGWWVTPGGGSGTNFGYALSARRPSAADSSGTLIVGAWQSSEAYGIDTRALTSPVVELGSVRDDLIVTLRGATDESRMGRGVGYVADFNGSGPALVGGGSVPVGDGAVSVTPLPAQGRTAAGTVPTGTPTPSTTATATAEPSATAEPTAAPTRSATAEPTAEPSAQPSSAPSATATAGPSASPSDGSTTSPVPSDTAEPSETATSSETAKPSEPAEPSAGGTSPAPAPVPGTTAGPNGADPADVGAAPSTGPNPVTGGGAPELPDAGDGRNTASAPTATTDRDAGTEDPLARTGATVLRIALPALALLAAGTAIVWISRRRKA